MSNSNETVTMKKELKLLDATLLVAGSMIGSGVFIVSAGMTRNVGSAGWLIVLWLIGGFMTLIAALSYGELSGMYPKAGGQFVYLREAYGPMIAFLYGWALFVVIQTGTIAAVAVSFSKFAAYFIPSLSEDHILFSSGSYKISAAQAFAIALIVFLTWVNSRGIRNGKWIQRSFTITKLLSLFGLIIFGFIMMKPGVWSANWSHAWDLHALSASGSNLYPTAGIALGAIAAGLVGSIFANDAWNNVTFIAGEIVNPKKNIGLSLLLGTVIVSIIYISVNLMFTAVLPMQDIALAEKDRVGMTASSVIFGGAGTSVIAVLIMISTFGCNNGMILSGARVYYTMAKEGLFLPATAKLNKQSVPAVALWLQCIVASILCISGRYGDLLDMVSFIVVIFYVLTIAGIFILRRKAPDTERPYKAFGYPVLPVLYIVMGLAFCGLLAVYKPGFTWPGFIIVLTGVPLYFLLKARKEKKPMTIDTSAMTMAE
ncbi:MAG: amino acid permease [Bacteroidetes bacterium]|nr:amino acid permease [Bacteroidota bacterium]